MVGTKSREINIPVRREESGKRRSRSNEVRGSESRDAQRRVDDSVKERETDRTESSDAMDWRDMAMRLRAEMDNFRKRQKRWAQGEILDDKVRLLTRFLDVMDHLETTLEHLDDEDPHHQAVQFAFDEMMKLLISEGVERIFALGRSFDPQWHEAVAMVPAPADQVEEMRVVEVVNPGYRLDNRVLRPTKVVVAKRGA
jgi:molecular chaperone GrpE